MVLYIISQHKTAHGSHCTVHARGCTPPVLPAGRAVRASHKRYTGPDPSEAGVHGSQDQDHLHGRSRLVEQ